MSSPATAIIQINAGRPNNPVVVPRISDPEARYLCLPTLGGRSTVSFTHCYGDIDGQVSWVGRQIDDVAEYRNYIRETVSRRLFDAAERADFEDEIRSFATSEMNDTILQLMQGSFDMPRRPWEVGEAFAECVIADEYGAIWPWHMDSDRRTPKASLPGADIVGFIEEGAGPVLLVGEVKVSSDQTSPPNVMQGRSGMIQQLDRLARDVTTHGSLMRWLRTRCRDAALRDTYKKAVQRYIKSNGYDIRPIGVLLRDTRPTDSDLRARAIALAARVLAPMRVTLAAWYVPEAVESLTMLVASDAR